VASYLLKEDADRLLQEDSFGILLETDTGGVTGSGGSTAPPGETGGTGVAQIRSLDGGGAGGPRPSPPLFRWHPVPPARAPVLALAGVSARGGTHAPRGRSGGVGRTDDPPDDLWLLDLEDFVR
jgi:hypothetical protein